LPVNVTVQHKLQISKRTFGIGFAALAFPNPGCDIKRWENSKVGFHGLKVLEVGVCHIMTQRAEHGRRRQGNQLFVLMQARRIDTGQQSCRDIPHVALDTCDLTGEEQIIPLDVLQGGA
jgi:hypothetical protein